MTLEEVCAELAKIFSGPPEPRGKCTWQHRQYDLVRLEDGSITFVRNALDAEIDQAFTKALDEIYGPEPEPGGGRVRAPSLAGSKSCSLTCNLHRGGNPPKELGVIVRRTLHNHVDAVRGVEFPDGLGYSLDQFVHGALGHQEPAEVGAGREE
jgi:hypothetical protein